MDGSFEIREYLEGGRSPFSQWFNKLDATTAERVDRYIRRLEAGNFCNTKPLREGLFEPADGFRSWLPRLLWARRSDHYHPGGRREQAAAGRRYCSRCGTLETLRTIEKLKWH